MKVAERLCDKIAIIESGSIMAEGTLADLRLKSGAKDSITIKIQEINAMIINKLKMNPSQYTIDNLKNTICVRSNDIDKDIVEIVNCIHNNNGKIMSIESASVDLENIFMKLTGKTLKS
jgi:ABC-2 type transport system ATP-binding protein